MGTVVSAGAVLTILVVVVFAALFLCAATWDALVDACQHIKDHVLRP